MSTPVEEIKERLNIVDIVQEYTPLKKTGANHKGLCPFHNEKSPSFTVSEQKQFFHCFGCGKGGDLFTFIELTEGVEFAEALRMLAKKANVQLRPTNPREHNERTKLLDALTAAADFYMHTLRSATEAQVARDYLTQRGLSQETIDLFEIGYSPASWDALITQLRAKGHTDTELKKAGLATTSSKNNQTYDWFRERVMFPIYNTHGNVVGFGGRTLSTDKEQAKYVNSPQTPVYNKSAVLYGLHLAKKYIQKMNAAVVVEGYMDVVTAHQAKFRNVVAASGTALTHEQIRLLKRYTTNVILSFDADPAGLSAAWRGMQIAIEEGMNIKVMILPEGQDPDDLIRTNPEQFRLCAANALPFMDYAFNVTLQSLDLTNVMHKKQAVQQLLPVIALFPDPVERTHYLQKLAALVHVSEAVLQETINRQRAAAPKVVAQTATAQSQSAAQPPQPAIVPPHKPNAQEAQSERLLALISLIPQDFGTVAARLAPEAIVGELSQRLYKLFQELYNRTGTLDITQLIFSDPTLKGKWQELQLIGAELYQENSVQEQQQELLILLESVERHRIKRRLQQVELELASAEQQIDSATIQRLSEEFRTLTELLRKFS